MTDTHKPPAAGHSADDKKHDAKDHGHGDKHEHKEHPIVPPTVELSDRLSHSAKVAGIMAEIRALVGENITGAARLDPIAGALDAAEAKRHINKIVENLYESRDPNIDHVRDAIHKRFEALLPDEFLRPSAAHSHGHNAAHAAGDEEHGHGGEIDPIHRTLVIGRALLDSVYEQIKDVDLVKMATSIAANIKVPTIKDHYYDGAKLTPEGLKLIEKLRKGGTNPVKVILAFSAAVDPGHFHPAGISSTTPSASVDAQKDINAELGLPEKNIPGAYKFLERLAVAVEAYKNTPRSELAFEPPTPPTTTSLRSTDTGQESFQKREERYQNAKNLVKAIGDAARRLAIYLHKNPVDSLKGFRRILKSFEPLPPELPNADHVKATLSAGLGTDLLSAEKYKELAEKKDSGMVGSRACDQILGTYIRRVTSVSEETAKDALCESNFVCWPWYGFAEC
jgi:GNAT superfamily N-acetyltransferase